MSSRILRPCANCQAAFTPRPYMLSRGGGRYCSIACAYEGRRKGLNLPEREISAPFLMEGAEACRVSLTNGGTMLVDASDAHLFRRHATWWETGRGNDYRYAKTAGARFGKSTPIRVAHVFLPPPPGAVVDHVNGNTLDNRRSNLRVVTRTENALNRHSGHSSPWGPNISFWSNRYRVRVKHQGRLIHQSNHRELAEALSAADAARTALRTSLGVQQCPNA